MRDCDGNLIEIGDRVLLNPFSERQAPETYTTIAKIMDTQWTDIVILWKIGSSKSIYRFHYDVKKYED